MTTINNQIYNELNDRWYMAFDDPVALLRAESKLIAPWIVKTAKNTLNKKLIEAVDLGCGGGFISNHLALSGFRTIAFDLSVTSLEVAARFDKTKSVDYREGDVTKIPLDDCSCDVVSCCDVIEHVTEPHKIVSEAFRILRPGGMFFFHTFNRNFFAYVVAIKFVEWFVKNTPRDLHVLSMFVKPQELARWAGDVGFINFETVGIRPSLRSLLHPRIFLRVVPESLQFKFTNNTWLSYAGHAQKP